MTELLIAADDRTGALETAAACADAGWLVELTVGAPPADRGPGARRHVATVVDLATRHREPGHAARRAGSMEANALRHAHKMDSTLRGNWAVELAGRIRAGRGRIVVAAAFPAAGRVCEGGVVYDHGVPVADGPAGQDPRRPVRESAPAAHLRAASVDAVAELADADGLAVWLASRTRGVAVVDASTDADLDAIAALVAAHGDVVLAGTAATIGAFARRLGKGARPPAPFRAVAPALVVVGSAHPMARLQVAALVAAGGSTDDRTAACFVVTAPDEAGDPVDVASDLAARAAAAHAERGDRTLVIVGGDTAEAVLGRRALRVDGSVDVGVARCRLMDDPGVTVLTKPGGFGDEGTLVRLLGLGG